MHTLFTFSTLPQYKNVAVSGVNNGFSFEPSIFLSRLTSEQTFTETFAWLYTHLRSDYSREKALNLLKILKKHQDVCGEDIFFRTYNFKFMEKDGLDLIVFKSTFEPESWSNVLKTGITTHLQSQENWDGKTMCEVGCGTGFLSLCLAKMMPKSHIIGVDYNPDAVLCSNINAVLNGITNATFNQSDLLGSVRPPQDSYVALIVACLPQIVSPGLRTETVIMDTDLAGKESISHFAPPQGNEWDTSGLGLNARFLEQVKERFPQATVLLNLAGRLGQDFINTFFKQLGFASTALYTATFPQASTGVDSPTNISAFSAWEKQQQGITCDFFLNADGTEKVSAEKAQKLLDSGTAVFHTVTAHQLTHLNY